jgi:hypothetical protein
MIARQPERNFCSRRIGVAARDCFNRQRVARRERQFRPSAPADAA